MTLTSTPAPWGSAPMPAIKIPGARLARVNVALWRVVDRAGVVRGHLQAVSDPLGIRYRARRFRVSAGAFLDVGEFWSADDAVAALMAR